MLVVIALTWSVACEPHSRVTRRQAGDTTFVSTRVSARLDTAQLHIDHVQVLKLADSSAAEPRITAFAVDAQSRIVLATDDGALRRLDSHARQQSSARISNREVLALQVHADGSVLARDLRGDTYLIGTDNQTQLLPDSATDKGSEDRLAEYAQAATSLLHDCPRVESEHFRSGSLSDIRVRYLPSLQTAVLAAGGEVIGCNARYSFDIIDAQGRRTRVKKPYQPVLVSADEHKSFIAAWTLRMRNSAPGPAWSWQGDSLPDQKPAYQRMLTASDNRIWIWPAQPSVRIAAPVQWVLVGGPKHLWVEPSTGVFDVFNADGSYVGPVAVSGPLSFAPYGVTPAPVIRADTLWLVQTDSAGASTLVRAHVRWPRKQK